MSFPNLEENDYKILVFILESHSVSKAQISKCFTNKVDGIENRLQDLLSASCIEEEYGHTYVNNGNGTVKRLHNGVYHITDFGKKVLQDHTTKIKALKFDVYFNRALAVLALIISIIALIKP